MVTSAHDIPVLDKAGLRKFGLTTGAIFVGLFGLLLPWLRGRVMPEWPFIVGAAFAVPGLLVPVVLKPVYAVWMRVGNVLGWINTRIILGVFFFVLLVPLALVMKLSRKDAMARAYDKNATSYRVPSRQRDIKHMEAPF